MTREPIKVVTEKPFERISFTEIDGASIENGYLIKINNLILPARYGGGGSFHINCPALGKEIVMTHYFGVNTRVRAYQELGARLIKEGLVGFTSDEYESALAEKPLKLMLMR